MLEESAELPEATPEVEEVEPDPSKTYWAKLPPDLLAEAVEERVREHFEVLTQTNVLALYKKAHAAFYSLSENGSHEASQVIEFGDNGEMLGVRSNQLRSIVRYILTSATADRPAWQPKATSASTAATSQIPLARTLLEYYHKKKGLEQALISTALRSLIYGKGYLWETWDTSSGPRDPKTAQTQGDVAYRALSPHEVACDPERRPGEHDWYIIRVPRNKYDLAAQYGGANEELHEYLLGLSDDGVEADLQLKNGFSLGRTTKDSDNVATWHLLHRPTPACPEGRYTITCGKARVLFDGPLPFADLHVYDMTPEEFLEAGNLGYGTVWEIMGLQQVYDGMLSTAISNFDAMGTNDVLIPDGVNLGYEEIRDGLNVIRHPANQAPSVLEKFQLGDPFFKLFEGIRSNMQLALGVNNVVRGDPEASLKSGSALALIQAQAVHFQSAFQGSYVRLCESAGTGTIQLLKKFATSERVAAVAGAYDTDALRSFKSNDIEHIDRVDIEIGNPVGRTVAGKVELATQMLERGLIKDANQYMYVMETGRLEPVTDPGRRALLRVTEENELLMQGPTPMPSIDKMTGLEKLDPMTGAPIMQIEGLPVVVTQNPVAHIQGHAAVLDSAIALGDPRVVTAVTAHLTEHLRVWREADPELLTMLGYPVYGAQAQAQEEPAEKGGDPAKGANDQKKAETAEKKTGATAPGNGKDAKLPQPAKPPPVPEV